MADFETTGFGFTDFTIFDEAVVEGVFAWGTGATVRSGGETLEGFAAESFLAALWETTGGFASTREVETGATDEPFEEEDFSKMG